MQCRMAVDTSVACCPLATCLLAARHARVDRYTAAVAFGADADEQAALKEPDFTKLATGLPP